MQPAGAASSPTIECPAARIASPSWTFNAASPTPDITSPNLDLSGRWIEVSPDAPPGPVRRQPYCYEGGAFITLEHTNDTVTLSWAFVAHVVGPPRPPSPDDVAPHEAGRGSFRDAQLVVETVAAAPRGRCVAKHYALTLDARGHLVGTQDGKAIRLAPVSFDPELMGGRSVCGPTPQ
jgi:hypothetical protein